MSSVRRKDTSSTRDTLLRTKMPKMQYTHDEVIKDMTDMNIAFASGKGGTGKTTISVNLAYLLALSKQKIQYLDCDVEEPNGHIFLKPDILDKTTSEIMVPLIDNVKCTRCGMCSDKCQFNALATLPSDVLVFPELCHGCGLCVHICPEKAISEGKREIGRIEKGIAIQDIGFVHGILNVGEPMAVPLIQEVKHQYKRDYIRIIDAPPGTSCPVVKTISDADVVVIVTEPTPFGLHDLQIAVSVAKNLKKPIGIVINRDNGKFPLLETYLFENKLPVLMVLPEDLEIAKHYSTGNIILKTIPSYTEKFKELAVNIEKLLDTSKGRW